ncbi:C-terminal binding protein [Homoserinimonas sp. OAct 916]|uniref:C-terminal binding protein n=1 Tax=Homoserinimonas sp. OAct 916 TaxID=2211450 RepID=UPI000DBE4CDC|nr:C-terminal binding protein [Homoserinimonas sp. OAct 916]
MQQRVVVTDHAFQNVVQEAAMARALNADFAEFSCASEAETVAAVTGADVAFVNFAPVNHAVLSALNPGATVVRYGIGYDNVDIETADELGVQVANVPDYGIQTVADHASAGLLTLARRIPMFNHEIRARGWIAPAGLGPIRSFRSMTVGLVGLGKIAQEVVARLRPFGFQFVAYDPYCPRDVADSLGVQIVEINELAQRSHAISLHAPSTSETHRIINAEFLSKVPEGAVIVNTARGSLIDEAALVEAIRSGRVAGAALDVTDPEPVPSDSPLRELPGVVFTPHAAFYDEQSLHRLQQLASEEGARALRGEPLRCKVV